MAGRWSSRLRASGRQLVRRRAPAPGAPKYNAWLYNPRFRGEVQEAASSEGYQSLAEFRASTGDQAAVRALQMTLQREGLYKGAIDGVMGPRTKAALQARQEKRATQQQANLDAMNANIEKRFANIEAERQRLAIQLRDRFLTAADKADKYGRKQEADQLWQAAKTADRVVTPEAARTLIRELNTYEKNLEAERRKKQDRSLWEKSRDSVKGLAGDAFDGLTFVVATGLAGAAEVGTGVANAVTFARGKPFGNQDRPSFTRFNENVQNRKGGGDYVEDNPYLKELPLNVKRGLGFGIDMGGDPTWVASKFVRAKQPLGSLSRVAQADRVAFFTDTRVGKAAVERIAKVVEKRGLTDATDAGILATRVRGLATSEAETILRETAEHGNLRKAIAETLGTGGFAPRVPFTKQAAAAATGGRVGMGGVVKGGVRGRVGDSLRGLANPDRAGATFTPRNARAAVPSAVREGLGRMGTNFRSFYDTEVAPKVASLSVTDRFGRISQLLDTIDSPALREATEREVKAVLDEIRKNAPAGASGISRTLSAPVSGLGATSTRRLERVEALVEMAASGGKEGTAALRALEGGLTYSKNRDMVNRALEATGQSPLGSKSPRAVPDPNNVGTLRSLIAVRVKDPVLREELLAELEVQAAKGTKGNIGRLWHEMDVLTDPAVADEYARLTANRALGHVARKRAFDPAERGLGKRVAGKVAKGALAIAEPSPHSVIDFERTPNKALAAAERAERIDRWMRDLGVFDEASIKAIRAQFHAVTSEKQLRNALRQTATRYAELAGVDPKMFDDLMKPVFDKAWKRDPNITWVDQATGETIDNPQLVSQLQQSLVMPDPKQLRQAVRELKALDADSLTKMRKMVSDPDYLNRLDQTLPSGKAKARLAVAPPEKVVEVLKKIHTNWKFLVVTNIHTVGIGAVGGAIGTEGDLGDKAVGAAKGAAIGAVIPSRYVMRVVGIEERFGRYLLHRGFSPKEFIPSVSKRLSTRGIDIQFASEHFIHANTDITGAFGTAAERLAASATREWQAIPVKSARGLTAWGRAVNWQWNVERDVVAEILTREAAGVITTKQADDMLDLYRRSEEGQLALTRLRSGRGNSKLTWDKMVDQYRVWRDTYLPTADVAAARLQGHLDRDVLKALEKAGNGPQLVHAQRTFKMPRTWKEVGQFRNTIVANTLLEGPTQKFNRLPMARWIYHDEYKRLLAHGVEPERAATIADEFAVRETNRVMFNINDQSRFARKADFLLPFQQPREEMVRVYANLFARNIGRTLQMGRLGAQAFNEGKESGTFRQDSYGQWTMTVPGSARMSRLLGGPPIGFDASLRGLFYLGSGAYSIGFVPTPGGPYWSVLSRTVLNTKGGGELYLNNIKGKWWEQAFAPYGVNGGILSPAGSRLWMGTTHSAPVWEFPSRQQRQDEISRREQEAARFLIAEWLRLHPGDYTYTPSAEDIREVVSATFQTQALLAGLFPSPSKPMFPGEELWRTLREKYTTGVPGGESEQVDRARAIKDHPELEPYIRARSKTKPTEDGEYMPWTDGARDVNLVRYKTGNEYLTELREARRAAQAYADFDNAINTPHPVDKERAIQKWQEKYSDIAGKRRGDYMAKYEIDVILKTYPKAQQDAALKRVQRDYGLTGTQLHYFKRTVQRGFFVVDPWKAARPAEQIAKDVQKKVHEGYNEFEYVATLAPAEQIGYWSWKRVEIANRHIDGSPEANEKLIAEWKEVQRLRGEVFRTYRNTLFTKPASEYDRFIANWRGDVGKALFEGYNEINRLRDAIDGAAKREDWRSVKALKAKRDEAYKLVRAIRNKAYHQFDGLDEAMKDVQAMVMPSEANYKQVMEGFAEATMIPSSEVKSYLDMPENVKTAFVQDLVDALDAEPFTKGKLFYEWLTDFQRDLLEANMPEAVKEWKAITPENSGGGKGGYGKGGFSVKRGELGYAYAMFKEYNRRTGTEPAAYKEYLALPNNPAVKAAFLKAHPDVQAWVKAGPMANMPPALRFIVANIMVKYGKWDGEERSWQELTDLSFTQEQLARWNRRGDRMKPETYDLWRAMPSGPDKAAYLKAHPEVTEWIRLGPMANMPDEYQDVVRDIMNRYGEWSSDNDPLSATITEYYSLPPHAREVFLTEHPELVAYWAATRSEEDQALYNLADQYFAIQDVGAKRMFLAAHPELSDFFVTQRTKRYNRFLARVAVELGQNPDLFNEYLERQEDILAEMLRKFAEPVIVRELRPQTDKRRASQGESGRVRQR